SRMYEQAGRKLQFEPWRDEALQVLCQYFSDDASFEERGQALGRSWSLEKGILIVGPVGCGKTSMLRLFEMNQKRSFRMFNTLEVYEDIRCQKEKGDRKRLVAQLAGRQPGMHGKVVFGQDYEDVALDDLGTDQACNDYGTSEDFIADLLYKRHEAKLTTHGTSNLVKLDADHFPFRERYGDRLASRFAQMFNMIIFPNDATDLRSL
ncbi:MAG TPA: hypothetical protein VEY71_05380, partial [Chitinophagales bacterium]|nr:hypothetical protein [Chitinophagales bacterium]